MNGSPLSFVGDAVSGVSDPGNDAVTQVMNLIKLLGETPQVPRPVPPRPPRPAQRILGGLGDAILSMASVRAGGQPVARGPFAQEQLLGQQDYQKRLEEANQRQRENEIADRSFKKQALLTGFQQQGREDIQAMREEVTKEMERLRHEDRVRQIEAAEERSKTAAHLADISRMRAEETERHNRELEGLRAQQINKKPAGKFLDPATRNQLAEMKAGADTAKKTLEEFNRLGQTPGGPIAGRVPGILQPKTTQAFNARLVAAVARLRKALAGSAVTPTELQALLPLLPQISQTPQQIVSGLQQIQEFFEDKSRNVLAGLEASGVSEESATEARKVYGGTTPPEVSGQVETPQQKLDRLKRKHGL